MRSGYTKSVVFIKGNISLMSRKELGFLLQQYLDGKCTSEEKEFIEHWYGTLQQDDKGPVAEKDFQTLEPMIWRQIQARTQIPKVVRMPVYEPRRQLSSWMAVAASVMLLFIAGWWFYNQEQSITISANPQEIGHADWLQHTNDSEQPESIRLMDGSQVRLAPQSSIAYPAQFVADKREVFLIGEGFFEVEKMPSRPFYVYTGTLVTKVLGTSFFVKTQAATQKVIVEVVTGRVAVYNQSKASETASTTKQIVLRPNQKVTYHLDSQQFEMNLVEHPQIIPELKSAVAARSFAFDDVPLQQVIDQLEEAYGITITLENPTQGECPLTADLSNLSLYAQLDMICAATKSSYAVQETTIVISGKGCDNL